MYKYLYSYEPLYITCYPVIPSLLIVIPPLYRNHHATDEI